MGYCHPVIYKAPPKINIKKYANSISKWRLFSMYLSTTTKKETYKNIKAEMNQLGPLNDRFVSKTPA